MRALLVALLVAGLGAAPALAQSTETALRQAREARSAGDLPRATKLVQGVLRREPLNYLALYNMGLIAAARAERAAPGPERARHLRDAAQWLERARAQRAPQKIQDATIFNTLGTVYLQLGELQKAEAALMEGKRNEAALSATSRGQLYSSIGYLNALKGDTKAALPALEQASRLGNRTAADNYERVKEQDAQMQMRQQAIPPRAP